MFAVVRKSSKKKKHFDLDSFSDSDNEVTSKRTKSNSVAVEVIADKIDDLRDDIVSVKCVMQDVLCLSSSSNIPLGLQRLIRDSFQCKICLAAPITPPVMLSKCCKTIIGCESCVNQWYSGDDALTKMCPNCRVERGYSETMLLRGLDAFLIETKEVIQLRSQPQVAPRE